MAFLEEHDVYVDCSNYDSDELLIETDVSRVSTRCDDGRNVALPDNSYDLVHSNSVIEHVGNFESMKAFAGEVKRLAPSYYVQTPYFWFPIDPHFYKFPFFHWVPTPLQMELLRRFRIGHSAADSDIGVAMSKVESRSILTENQMRHLFADGNLRFEHFLLMRKSMIVTREGVRDH